MTARFLDDFDSEQSTQKEKMSAGDFAWNVVRAIGQGLTFGFADEAEAYARSVLGDEGYEEALEDARGGLEQLREESPVIGYGAEIAGSLPYGLVGGALRTGARKLGQEAIESVLSSTSAKYLGAGGAGALYGAGASEEGSRAEGALLGGVLGAGAQKIAPAVTASAKELINKGIPVPIGQALGGGYKRFEEGVSSLPYAGDVIRLAQQRAVEKMNPAVINEALEPLGKKVSMKKTGEEAYKEATKIISDEYNAILGDISVDVPMSGDDFIRYYSDKLSPDKLGEFKSAIKNEFDAVLKMNNKKLDKDAFQAIRSKFRDLSYKTKANPKFEYNEQLLAAAYTRVANEMGDLLEDELSEEGVKRLAKIDEAYSRFAPIRIARSYAEPTEGVFSPAQLQRAIKSDRGKEEAYNLGQLPLQQTARKAREVLGKELSDSGTATRSLIVNTLLGGGAGSQVGMPVKGALIGAGTTLAYTPVGQYALRQAAPAIGRSARTPAAAGLVAGQFSNDIPRLDITLDDLSEQIQRSLLGQ